MIEESKNQVNAGVNAGVLRLEIKNWFIYFKTDRS
jgi:hypothetical protein